MDRKEFVSKAEQIENAAFELAEQIRELAKLAQSQDWLNETTDDLCGAVNELSDFANEIEEAGSCVGITFKTQDEL